MRMVSMFLDDLLRLCFRSKFVTLLVLLIASSTYAKSSAEILKEIESKKCLDIYGASVVSKISDYEYEMKYRSGYGYSTALLKTKATKFTSKGRVGSLYVQKTEMRKVKMKDGFEKEIPVWVESEECKLLGEKRSMALKREHEAEMSERMKNRKKEKKKKQAIKKAKKEENEKFNELFE